MKVIIICNGTRGDFQPYLSVGVCLRTKGHNVKFYTSQSHARMAEEFGFPSLVTSGDMEEFLRGPICKESMEKGDFALCAGGMKEIMSFKDPEELKVMLNEDLTEFKPDFIIFNAIGLMAAGAAVSETCPNCPRVNVELQPQAMASNDYKPSSFQRQLPDEDTPPILIFFWTVINEGAVECYRELFAKGTPKEEILRVMDFTDTPECSYEGTFEPEKWLMPRFLAYSPSFWVNPSDWPKSDNIKVLGNFKLSKETQDEYTKKGSKYFSVGSDFARCEDFVKRVGKPVYVGWGSMVVYTKQHMTLLAVQALKRAGEKGIILAGWAQIGPDGLDGVENEEELRAWCEENVLFIKAAPHELLFPMCKAAVHHGGIGTLQVSLSNGCPTIITPVFADQFDNAKHLRDIDCGTSTTRLGKLRAKELGEAIKTICSEPRYKVNCEKLSLSMAKEDGVGDMVAWMEKYHAESGLTGKHEERRLAWKERLYELREKNKKLDTARMTAKYQSVLQGAYPPVKQWAMKSMALTAQAADLVTKKKLWVASMSIVAREGQGLKTEEVGRYQKWAWLQELGRDAKGGRIHVKKLSGRGPAEGWVSKTVKEKDVIWQPDQPAMLGMIKQQEYNDCFSDVTDALTEAWSK